jgi:hypothetical protein
MCCRPVRCVIYLSAIMGLQSSSMIAMTPGYKLKMMRQSQSKLVQIKHMGGYFVFALCIQI